ncbi:putative tricarboxylic transport membrane protein [Arthrobacter sp. CAN_A6]|uniref:tripartite tricarboxylate transporter TctB family protein n=1 Tax=Arthrobacter sp. CAN_A6 TaxID=2787721 RepID=UPI0018CAFC96
MSSVRTRFAGRSELGMAALLGAVGIIVLIDAAGINVPYSQADPVGPRTLPYIVGGLLLICAVLLTVNVLKGGQGEAEGGEDVDLTHPSDWRTILFLLAFFTLNIILIDYTGWVISGTILFWGSVWSLGSRHYVRDGIISLLLAIGTFYGFYIGLGIRLPAGLLEGVL